MRQRTPIKGIQMNIKEAVLATRAGSNKVYIAGTNDYLVCGDKGSNAVYIYSDGGSRSRYIDYNDAVAEYVEFKDTKEGLTKEVDAFFTMYPAAQNTKSALLLERCLKLLHHQGKQK
jgi:hypothetical protein